MGVHLLFVFILVLFGMTPVQAKTWDIQGYLQASLELDENLKSAHLQQQISMANYDSATDTFQNSLELRPNYYRRELKLPYSTTGALSDARTGMTFDMKQSLPTGSMVGFLGTRYFEKANPDFNGLNSDYKLYFEQALWRNSFGAMFRGQKESAESRVRQMSVTETKTLVDSCISSLELFLNAYLSQEEMKILEQVYKDGERAYSLAETGFQQRVLRKIDFLNAQSDFLRLKNELVKAKTLYEQRLAAVQFKISGETSLQRDIFNDPRSYFEQMTTPTILKMDEVMSYQAAIAKLEAESAAYRAKKSGSRSEVNVGVAGGRTTSISQATATTFGEALQSTVEVYVRLKLPLINKTLTAEVSNAFYNMQLAEIEKSLLERQIRQQFSQLTLDETYLREQIDIAVKNQKIKSQQLDEARRLLRVGKIQFEEYVRYRDSYFTEKTNELRLRSSLWQAKAKLAQFDQKIVNYCRGA